MKITRRIFTSDFNVGAVLFAIKVTQTLAESAVNVEVHPNRNQQRKKLFLDKTQVVFNDNGT